MRFSLIAVVVALTAPMFVSACKGPVESCGSQSDCCSNWKCVYDGPHEWHVTTFFSWSTKLESEKLSEQVTIAVGVTMNVKKVATRLKGIISLPARSRVVLFIEQVLDWIGYKGQFMRKTRICLEERWLVVTSNFVNVRKIWSCDEKDGPTVSGPSHPTCCCGSVRSSRVPSLSDFSHIFTPAQSSLSVPESHLKVTGDVSARDADSLYWFVSPYVMPVLPTGGNSEVLVKNKSESKQTSVTFNIHKQTIFGSGTALVPDRDFLLFIP
ncbi:hypothetical protein EV424DRAFT_1556720, partial [Suillus variegatus]